MFSVGVSLKMLSFQGFFISKRTFSETCALISRKYVSETGLDIPNLLEKLQISLSHYAIFALEYKL